MPQSEILELREKLVQLSQTIKDNKVKRSHNCQIDSAKALRIMLEYYRREKRIRVYILHELFNDDRVGFSNIFYSTKI